MHLWTKVLEEPAIRHLSPYVFLYCKNENVNELDMSWFLERGEVQPLKNVGRESHTYIWHITTNYDDLATHTLFHQDVLGESPQDLKQEQFLDRLSTFMPYTGMLALGHAAMCTCDTCALDEIPRLREIWAMTQHTFCGPTNLYPVFLKGSFIVSAVRIRRNMPQLYRTLLHYLEAPIGHWVHAEHKHDWARHPSNPISGHVMERAWNIIFDCIRLDGLEDCMELCDWGTDTGCKKGSCQCFDHNHGHVHAVKM